MATREVLPHLSEPETGRRQRPGRRWLPWLILLAFAVIAVLGWRAAVRRQQAQQQALAAQARAAALRPIPVTVAKVEQRNFPIYLTGLGSVTAFNTDTIQTRVDGQIMKVFFREGQHVAAGQPLVEIDPRPYQVQLEQAQGQLSRDQAQLNNAIVDLGRDKALVASGVIPKQQFDTQTALVAQLQGSIQADKAQIASAQLNLAYCHITAPISGKVGLRLVDPGNIVHASDTTGLIVITQMQPIAVIFTLPQELLAPILQGIRRGQSFPVDAYDRADQHKIASGTLVATDNRVDQTTGTLRLKAVFANQDELLFPNEFVNVHIQTQVLRNALLIPASSLQHGTQGDFVFVVQPDNTVEQRIVQIDRTEGNFAIIRSGLAPSDTVVSDGLDRLNNGSHITPRSPQKASGKSA
ncbi:MAG: MdtA/MuxA family multidrug efflux RND transporter periplasmic adaptor subunit [Terriglobia bacterium]